MTGRSHVAAAAAGALAAVVFAAPVALLLRGEAAPVASQPLAPPGVTARSFTVDLDAPSRTDNRERLLRLGTRAAATLAAYDEIQITIATFGARPRLERARLLVPGTTCAYAATAGARLRNNQPLPFRRTGRCDGMAAGSAGLVLDVRLETDDRIAVWVRLPPYAMLSDEAVYLGRAPGEGDHRPWLLARGITHLPASGVRRIDLLAHIWDVSPSPRWLWLALLLAACVFGLGAWGLSPYADGRDGNSADRTMQPVAALLALAFALALSYAVIVPPFQAADEPNHFAAFGVAAGREGLQADSARLAERGHFERLQFRPEERFGPSDMLSDGGPWNDGTVPDSSVRGQGVEWLWSRLSPSVDGVPVPRLLLTLRLINVAFFAACVGFVAFAMVRWSGLPRPELLVLPLLFVPALPFFGMHVSNHAVVLGLYLIAGAGVLLLVLDGRHAHLAGPLIGAAWPAAVLASRAAAPLLPFVLVLALTRLVLGDRDGRRWTAFVFWPGLAIPAAAALAFGNQAYLEGLMTGAAGTLTGPAAALRLVTWCVVPAGVALALVEATLSPAVRRTRWRPSAGVVRTGGLIAAAVTCLASAAAIVVSYPTLQPLQAGHSPDPADYLRDVLAAGLTLFRFALPDRLTSYTFWGGFGWLEFGPPEALVGGIAGASGMALVGLFLWIAHTGSLRAAIWIAAGLGGYVAALAAYAWVIATATPADFHGRYVLGLYVWLLLICWSAVPRVAALIPRPRLSRCLPLLCAAIIAAVHAIALVAIVRRYFG